MFQLSPTLNILVWVPLTHPGTLSIPESVASTTKDLTIAGVLVIDKHIPVIWVLVGKNIVEDIQIDGGSGVNVVSEDKHERLGLSKPSPAPFNLKIANGSIGRTKGLIWDVEIHIHGIPYIVILKVINSSRVKSDYGMLLG